MKQAVFNQHLFSLYVFLFILETEQNLEKVCHIFVIIRFHTGPKCGTGHKSYITLVLPNLCCLESNTDWTLFIFLRFLSFCGPGKFRLETKGDLQLPSVSQQLWKVAKECAVYLSTVCFIASTVFTVCLFVCFLTLSQFISSFMSSTLALYCTL